MAVQMVRTWVKVWDKDYEIRVYQKSKTVWTASVEYMGEHLVVQGRTSRDAIRQWCEAARYKGNDPPPSTLNSRE